MPRVRTLRKSVSLNLLPDGGTGIGASPGRRRPWEPAAAAGVASDGGEMAVEEGRLGACECATVAAMMPFLWSIRWGGGRQRKGKGGGEEEKKSETGREG